MLKKTITWRKLPDSRNEDAEASEYEVYDSDTGATIGVFASREAAENDLCVDNRCLLDLGLEPTTLRGQLLGEIIDVAQRYADRCDETRIVSTSQWVRPQTPDGDRALAV